MNIHPVGAELFMHTDMTKLIFACHSIVHVPKNGKDYLLELFVPLLTRPVMIKVKMERPKCPWCNWNRPVEPHTVIYQCDLHSARLFYCSC
jgi:hypothetical protein